MYVSPCLAVSFQLVLINAVLTRPIPTHPVEQELVAVDVPLLPDVGRTFSLQENAVALLPILDATVPSAAVLCEKVSPSLQDHARETNMTYMTNHYPPSGSYTQVPGKHTDLATNEPFSKRALTESSSSHTLTEGTEAKRRTERPRKASEVHDHLAQQHKFGAKTNLKMGAAGTFTFPIGGIVGAKAHRDQIMPALRQRRPGSALKHTVSMIAKPVMGFAASLIAPLMGAAQAGHSAVKHLREKNRAKAARIDEEKNTDKVAEDKGNDQFQEKFQKKMRYAGVLDDPGVDRFHKSYSLLSQPNWKGKEE